MFSRIAGTVQRKFAHKTQKEDSQSKQVLVSQKTVDIINEGLNNRSKYTHFDCTDLLPGAQRDIAGERKLLDVTISNGKTPKKDVIKALDSGETLVTGITVYIDQSDLDKKGNKKCIKSEAASFFIAPNGRVHDLLCRDLPADTESVKVNGITIPNCTSNADIEDFISNNDNKKKVITNAIVMKILKEILPDAMANEMGYDLLERMQAENPRACEVLMKRLKFLEQNSMNSVIDGIQATNNTDDISYMDMFVCGSISSYSVFSRRCEQAELSKTIPAVASEEFTSFIENAQIQFNIELSLNSRLIKGGIFMSMEDPRGQVNCLFSVDANGTATVDRISITDPDGGAARHYDAKKEREETRV